LMRSAETSAGSAAASRAQSRASRRYRDGRKKKERGARTGKFKGRDRL
jgi:hypothetical protein